MDIQTFNTGVLVWIGIAVILFPVLLKIPAPYGRHTKPGWGPLINNKIGWFLMELPALAVFFLFVVNSLTQSWHLIHLFILLWLMHYTYRSLLFPLLIKTGNKKMPLLIMLFAVFFNLINGTINGYWFGSLSPDYPENWVYDLRFVVGLMLFIAGFATHWYHDKILINLRKNRNSDYQIPRGGFFRYVSCPNFMGEIIQWGGFALMTWCLPTFSFFIWTCVNLIPRALDHHRWYKSSFTDYPKGRKAFIPFIL